MRNPRKKIKDFEIIKRFRAESPEFFKKVQWLGGILTSVGGLLVATPLGAPMITAGGIMFLLAKLPVKGMSVEDAKKLVEESEKLRLELETLKNSAQK